MAHAPIVIVAGMHRSGTSLVASMLAASGIEMGKTVVTADTFNPGGYFEDTAFLELNSRILAAATEPGDGGHRDWGWTASESFDRSILAGFENQAEELIGSRAESKAAWGWKDPRNALLLDFWDGAAEQPLFVLVYRFPWEVADSMQRLGEDVFLEHPEYALPIWAFYNRHLLDFYRSHSDRCLLISSDALAESPESLLGLLRQKLHLPLPEDSSAQDRFLQELFTRLGGDDPLITLFNTVFPEYCELLTELDQQADLSSRGLWAAAPHTSGQEKSTRNDLAAAETADLSVVIPCLDQGVWLVEAIASVERSVVDPYELIVIDDGSKDPLTLKIFESLEGAGYKIHHQPNEGLSAARDRGIDLSSGAFVLPLDSDNRILPGFTSAALAVFSDRSEVGIVYGDRWDFGKRSGTAEVAEFDLSRLLRANYIDACAMFRRIVWEEVGGYDPNLDSWEDWDFWIGAAEHGWKFCRLSGPAFDYRVRPDSRVSKTLQAEVRRELVLHIVEKHAALYRESLPEILLTAESEIVGLREVLAKLGEQQKGTGRLADQLHSLEAQNEERRRHQLALEGHIAELDRLISEKEAVLLDAAAYVEKLLGKITAIEEYARPLQVEVEGTQAALKHAGAQVDALEAHQENLKEYVSKLEDELAGKQTVIDEGADYSSNLKRTLEEVEARLTALAESEAELDEELSEYRKRVLDLEEGIESRDAELDRIHDSWLWRLTGIFRPNSKTP